MDSQSIYLVCDSSGYYNDPPFGIYASYDLAVKAMEDYIGDEDEDDEDWELQCYEISVNTPISERKLRASYENGEWHLE